MSFSFNCTLYSYVPNCYSKTILSYGDIWNSPLFRRYVVNKNYKKYIWYLLKYLMQIKVYITIFTSKAYWWGITQILEESLLQFLEDVPLATRIAIWFMYDGRQAHFSLANNSKIRWSLNWSRLGTGIIYT